MREMKKISIPPVRRFHRLRSPALASAALGGLLCVLAVCFGAGCRLETLDSNQDFRVGVQQDDIPVPRMFKFDERRSVAYSRYSSGVGSFRSWDGYYYGDQQVQNLVPWYLQQMAVDGWTHRESGNDSGRQMLTFSKGEETATIILYRDFDTRFERYVTIIKAGIHPTRIENLSHEEALRLAGALPGGPGQPLPEAAGEEGPGGAAPGARAKAAPVPAAALDADRRHATRGGGTAGAGAREGLTGGTPPPREAAPVRGQPAVNEPVVNEGAGTENNQDSVDGAELTPEDGE